MSAQTLLEARKGDSRFYTDIADGLRAVCRTDTEALAELHLRILFTILVSNNDDHLKNHGLLYAGEGNWALAPAQFAVGERFDRGPCNEYAPAFEHEETRIALGMGSPSVAVTGRTPDKKTPSSHES